MGGGNYSADAQGKSSNAEGESRFPQQVQALSSFIPATFRDLLIKGGFWVLYDGGGGTWLTAQPATKRQELETRLPAAPSEEIARAKSQKIDHSRQNGCSG